MKIVLTDAQTVTQGDLSLEPLKEFGEIVVNQLTDYENIAETIKDADAVIYVGGLTHDYDTEGRDRESMKLPYDQDNLICELLKVRPDTIVTLVAGSPVDMSAWINQAQAVVLSVKKEG